MAITALAVGLAACGARTGAGSRISMAGQQGTPTTTATSVASATSTANAPSPTGGVAIRLDRTQLATIDPVTATVVNGLSSQITATDHHSSCSLLDLQRQTSDGTWLTIAPCMSAIKTRLVPLQPNSATPQRLAPSMGDQNPPGGDAAWAPGTYRLALTYEAGSAQPATVYSAVFTIA